MNRVCVPSWWLGWRSLLSYSLTRLCSQLVLFAVLGIVGCASNYQANQVDPVGSGGGSVEESMVGLLIYSPHGWRFAPREVFTAESCYFDSIHDAPVSQYCIRSERKLRLPKSQIWVEIVGVPGGDASEDCSLGELWVLKVSQRECPFKKN